MRGANFLIESTVSILSPPLDLTSVLSKETPVVTEYDWAFLIYDNLPAKVKLLMPFAASPLETTYSTVT